jgi:hypothetical protein
VRRLQICEYSSDKIEMCCYERNLYIGSGKNLNMDREILSVKQYLVHKCKYTNSMDITSKLE